MKNRILYLLLLITISSCTALNHSNFNKQKFTKLKLKSIKTSNTEEKIAYSVVKNSVSESKIIPNKITQVSTHNKTNNTDYSIIIDETPIEKELVTVVNTINIEIIEKAESKARNKSVFSSIQKLKHKKSGLLFFSILLAVPFMLKYKKGIKISKWASKNRKKAQIVIGILGLTGIGSSYALGNILKLDINLSMVAAPLVLGGLALGIYKYKGTRKKKFIKDRLSFALLNIATFFGSFAAGSNTNHTLFNIYSENSGEATLHPILAALFILLLVALLVVAIIGLLLLACNIACAGFEILAIIVLLGGSALAISLTTLAIIAITKKVRSKYQSVDVSSKEKQTTEKKEVNRSIIAISIIIPILLLLGVIYF